MVLFFRSTFTCSPSRWSLTVALAALVLPPALSSAQRVARIDPTEPLFAERAFLDHSVELEVEWDKAADGHGIEIGPGIEWTLWDRVELDLEIPVGISIPDEGDTVADLADIGIAGQVLLCCETRQLLDFLSLRAQVDPPTGSRSKGIGGDGGWEVSLLPGRYFALTDGIPAVLVQAQVSYAQQIRLDDEQREVAKDLDLSKTRQKEVHWNVAFAQRYFGGVIHPVFEVLGTSVVEALIGNDEGTIVELAGGFWLAPHSDEHFLRAVSVGLGFKAPVTSLKEDQSVGVLIIEYALE